MMFRKANLEVNWLVWKWTRTGILCPTSGCKTPEIVLLNDLHSPCVCDFYESCCKIWNTWNLGIFRAPTSLIMGQFTQDAWIGDRVFEPNTKTNAEITWIILNTNTNIEKQEITKIPNFIFGDGAVAEEELWISRSWITLIPLREAILRLKDLLWNYFINGG